MRVPRRLWAYFEHTGGFRRREGWLPEPYNVAWGWSGLLQKGYVGVHRRQPAPRLATSADIPANDGNAPTGASLFHNPISSLGTPALAEEGGDSIYDCPRDVLLAHQRQLLWAAGPR